MKFENLMQDTEIMFNLWLNDNELNELFNGNIEDLQKEFLMCIQSRIKSKFILLSGAELQNKLVNYHNSMEGYNH